MDIFFLIFRKNVKSCDKISRKYWETFNQDIYSKQILRKFFKFWRKLYEDLWDFKKIYRTLEYFERTVRVPFIKKWKLFEKC